MLKIDFWDAKKKAVEIVEAKTQRKYNESKSVSIHVTVTGSLILLHIQVFYSNKYHILHAIFYLVTSNSFD